MEEKQNILIALDILDIGGVETFVYNQSIALKKKGYNVHIISKRGIFTDELVEKGINFIEFEFQDKIYYDFSKVKEMLEIFKKYNIQEVHINQFSAMNVLLPACLISNIPYVVYLHMASGIIDNDELNAYKYYEKQYCTYIENFKILFKYAYQIIAITPEIREYTIKRYQIEDEAKCIVIPNSINFETYKSNKKVKNIENISIVSRLSHEKLNVIINGIKLYQEIKKKSNRNVSLTIMGDGHEKEKIEKYVKDNKIEDVNFSGKISDMRSALEKSDLVIGVDRCILEAIAMKRLAIISGYDNMKGILKEQATNDEIDENFCGKSLSENEIEKVADEILTLDEKKIETIVEENYSKIREKLDINNNVYIVNKQYYEYKLDIASLLKSLTTINYIIGKKEEETMEKLENLWKEHIEYQNWIENQIQELRKNNQGKQKENFLKKTAKKILKKLRIYN